MNIQNQIRRISITLIIVLMFSTGAQAGEFAEWVNAVAFVYLSHENGHQARSSNRADMTWNYRGGIIPDYEVTKQPMYSLQFLDSPSLMELEFINSTIQPGYTLSGELAEYMNKLVYKASEDIKKNEKINADIMKRNQEITNNNNRTIGTIAGGGFVAQQEAIETLPDGEFKRKTTILSALLKGGYVIYNNYWCNGTTREYTGDIVKMRGVAPLSLITSALVTSAVTDIFRTAQPVMPTWRVDFVSDPHTGAVGLAFAGKF